jgi:hypothetical protein
LSIRYHTHIISELISKGAEKKFHDGKREVISMYAIPGRKVDLPSILW